MVKNNSETLGIIPARGGSQRLKRKNIKMLNGKPMMIWVAEAMKKSNIDRIIISTEDDEIKEIGENYGYEVMDRPAELANGAVTVDKVVENVLYNLNKEEGYTPCYHTVIAPTSPLVKWQDINRGLEMIKNNTANKLITVSELYHSLYTHAFKVKNNKIVPLDKYQSHFYKYDKTYWTNFTIMIYKTKRDIKYYNMLEDCLALKVDKYSDHDVDNIKDFKIAEVLLKERETND
ncbi:MAG: cytidylyltransferase domain-containing protein [Bacillota bacterium]